MKQILGSGILSLCFTSLCAQNLKAPYHPYQKFGDTKIEVLTLSNGKYNEFFDTDTVEIIGSAILNTKTMKVIGFVKKDTTYSEATLDPAIVSRWLSPDPLAAKYPSMSPYNFAINNPIIWIDPAGDDIEPSDAFKASPYKPVLDKLNTNSIFLKYTKPFSQNNNVNYKLDYYEFVSYKERNANTFATRNQTNSSPESATSHYNKKTFGLLGYDKWESPIYNEKPDPARTEIAIARTLIHESIHAYLYNLIETGGLENTDHHNYMATNFRQDIVVGLKEYALQNDITNLSDQDFEDLSWVGLQDTKAFSEQFKTVEEQKQWKERVDKLEYVEEKKD